MSRIDLLPGAGPVLSLRQAVYRAARDYRGGVTALAHDMAVDYDALQKKLHIERRDRHLTAEELEDMVRLTRDPRLLAALVRPAGAVAYVPAPVEATHDALQALGRLLRAEGDFVSSLHQGAADSRWELAEVKELRHHADRLIGKILGIVAGAELAMRADLDEEVA